MTLPRREPTASERKFNARRAAFHEHIAAAAERLKQSKMAAAVEQLGCPLRAVDSAGRSQAVDGRAGQALIVGTAVEFVGEHPAVVEFFGEKQAVTCSRIIDAVCREFKMSKIDLTSARRTADVVKVRQCAMWLCKELTRASYPAIGLKFGGRDHTTALHAWRVAPAKLANDQELRVGIMRVYAEMATDLGAAIPDVSVAAALPSPELLGG